MSSPGSRIDYLDWRIWTAYGVLFAVGIPWYWPASADWRVLGVPVWAAVSVLASFLVSALTAWLLIWHWPAAADDESSES